MYVNRTFAHDFKIIFGDNCLKTENLDFVLFFTVFRPLIPHIVMKLVTLLLDMIQLVAFR